MIGQKKEPAAGTPEGSIDRDTSETYNKDYTPNDQKSQYETQALKLAGDWLAASDDVKRQANYLILNPGEVPDKPADGWQALTMADFYKPREPIEYLLQGIVRRKCLGMVYGAPGDLKTMLLMDLSVCMALGKPWLEIAPWQKGGQPIPTIKTPVVWIDQDMGTDLLHERFNALGIQHKAPPDIPLKVYSFQDPHLDASDSASVAVLATRIAGAGLVVIDNLGTISGGIDENSSLMRVVMANLRWLAETTGAAILLIHHQRKPNGTIGGRAGDALRGHSSIEASLDFALHIDREPYSDQITLKSTKTRTREIAPFTAYFTFTQNDIKELETSQFYSVEPEDDSSNYAIEREIKAALEDGPMSLTTLWQAVKAALPDVGRPRILDQVRKLEADNRLIMTPGANNSKVYSLPVSRVHSGSQRFAGME
jgi:hypothetical protein